MVDRKKKEIEDYIDACESQLDNVLSSPIESGNYALPSADELDETTFLEDEIEETQNSLDLFDEEDDIVKQFFGIK